MINQVINGYKFVIRSFHNRDDEWQFKAFKTFSEADVYIRSIANSDTITELLLVTVTDIYGEDV